MKHHFGGNRPAAQDRSRGVVWVQDKEFVRPIRVTTGLSDESSTEVVSVKEGDALDEGTPLVTGESAAKGGDGAKNPFAPPPVFRPKIIKDDK